MDYSLDLTDETIKAITFAKQYLKGFLWPIDLPDETRYLCDQIISRRANIRLYFRISSKYNIHIEHYEAINEMMSKLFQAGCLVANVTYEVSPANEYEFDIEVKITYGVA
jgi:hypothetical protein